MAPGVYTSVFRLGEMFENLSAMLFLASPSLLLSISLSFALTAQSAELLCIFLKIHSAGKMCRIWPAAYRCPRTCLLVVPPGS